MGQLGRQAFRLALAAEFSTTLPLDFVKTESRADRAAPSSGLSRGTLCGGAVHSRCHALGPRNSFLGARIARRAPCEVDVIGGQAYAAEVVADGPGETRRLAPDLPVVRDAGAVHAPALAIFGPLVGPKKYCVQY